MCALGIGSFDKPVLTDQSLVRFRARLLEHCAMTGEDLMYNCITSMVWAIAGAMGIDGTTRRMDSMMIASSMQKLTRPGLAHRCCCLAVRDLARLTGEASISEDLQHFLKAND